MANCIGQYLMVSILAWAIAGCSDGPLVNHRLWIEQKDGQLALRGMSCMKVSDSIDNSSGDLGLSQISTSNDLVVKVFSDGELLASRLYDEEFLNSGRVDEFSVVTHKGDVYVIQHWGPTCQKEKRLLNKEGGI